MKINTPSVLTLSVCTLLAAPLVNSSSGALTSEERKMLDPDGKHPEIVAKVDAIMRKREAGAGVASATAKPKGRKATPAGRAASEPKGEKYLLDMKSDDPRVKSISQMYPKLDRRAKRLDSIAPGMFEKVEKDPTHIAFGATENLDSVSEVRKAASKLNHHDAVNLWRMQSDCDEFLADLKGTLSATDKIASYLKQNFTIRKDQASAFARKDNEKSPALLMWVKSRGEKAVFSANGAVLFHPEFLHWVWTEGEPGGAWKNDLQVSPFFETHTSTAVKASTNNLYYGLPFFITSEEVIGRSGDGKTANGKLNTPLVTRWQGIITPAYLSDRANKFKEEMLIIEVVPTIPALHMNLGLGDSKYLIPPQTTTLDTPIQFPLKPAMGKPGSWFEWGTTASMGFKFANYEAGGPKMTPALAAAGVKNYYGSFEIGVGLHATLFQKVKLSGSYNAAYEILGTMRPHEFWEYQVSIPFGNPEHLSVNFTYMRGEQETDYKRVNQVSASLGIQF